MMAKNSENHGKWDTNTYDQEYGKKQWQTWKMRNAHCRTQTSERNNEKRERWEINTVGPGLGEKTENHGKWETHNVGTGI